MDNGLDITRARYKFGAPLPKYIFVDKTRRITKDYYKWTAIMTDVYFIKMSTSRDI